MSVNVSESVKLQEVQEIRLSALEQRPEGNVNLDNTTEDNVVWTMSGPLGKASAETPFFLTRRTTGIFAVHHVAFSTDIANHSVKRKSSFCQLV